jgi:outer membrane lipoprotein-sorting protein
MNTNKILMATGAVILSMHAPLAYAWGKSECIAIVMPSMSGMTGNTQELANSVRDLMASYLTAPSIRLISLDAKLPSLAVEEAREKGCESLLYLTVTRKTGSRGLARAMGQAAASSSWAIPYGGSVAGAVGRVGAVGGLQAAASLAQSTKAKDEIHLDYRLESPSGQVQFGPRTETRRANADGEDILTPVIAQAAEAIVSRKGRETNRAAVPAEAVPAPAPAPLATPGNVLEKSRAAYAALRSYSDTGTVVIEYGTSRDKHTFQTYFRAPRFFYFEFTKANNTDKYVVWSDDAAFHSWWKTTGVTNDYPKENGIGAFTTGSVPTKGSLSQISELLFPNFSIVGTINEFADGAPAGTEMVNGRMCYKVAGVSRSTYGATGHVVNVRRTTIWIDVETLLIRKVLEDWSDASRVDRRITTFEPRENPPINDSQFQFNPKGGR